MKHGRIKSLKAHEFCLQKAGALFMAAIEINIMTLKPS